jgi:hypothetical protein
VITLLSLFWVDAGDDSIPLFAFTDRIVIYAKLLGNEVNYASLLWRESSRKREFVPHTVVFEK